MLCKLCYKCIYAPTSTHVDLCYPWWTNKRKYIFSVLLFNNPDIKKTNLQTMPWFLHHLVPHFPVHHLLSCSFLQFSKAKKRNNAINLTCSHLPKITCLYIQIRKDVKEFLYVRLQNQTPNSFEFQINWKTITFQISKFLGNLHEPLEMFLITIPG